MDGCRKSKCETWGPGDSDVFEDLAEAQAWGGAGTGHVETLQSHQQEQGHGSETSAVPTRG